MTYEDIPFDVVGVTPCVLFVLVTVDVDDDGGDNCCAAGPIAPLGSCFICLDASVCVALVSVLTVDIVFAGADIVTGVVWLFSAVIEAVIAFE